MSPSLLVNTQFALFFAQPIGKPEEFWRQMSDTPLGHVFDGTPRIQPVPMDPNLLEVPVVQLASSRKHTLSISRSRADFTYVEQQGGAGEDRDELFLQFFHFFEERTLIRRIGYVKRWFAQTDEPPQALGKLLSQNPEQLQGGVLHEVHVRFTTREKIGNFESNNYTALEAATVDGSDGSTMTGLLITRDLNTVPEQNYLFDEEILRSYFGEAEKKLSVDSIKM